MILKHRKEEKDDILIDFPCFKEKKNEHMIVGNEHVLEKESENEKVQRDALEMENYLSFTSNIDFIGIDVTIIQEKGLANFGYNILERCFISVEIEEQCVRMNEAQVHAQIMLMDSTNNWNAKALFTLCGIYLL